MLTFSHITYSNSVDTPGFWLIVLPGFSHLVKVRRQKPFWAILCRLFLFWEGGGVMGALTWEVYTKDINPTCNGSMLQQQQIQWNRGRYILGLFIKMKVVQIKNAISLRPMEVLWIVKCLMLLDCGPEIFENGYNMGTLILLGSIVWYFWNMSVG